MRAPVINRFAKLAPLSVATLLLTSGITLITADTAWACGDGTSSTAPAQEHHRTDPTSTFLPPAPDKITVGGDKVEFGLQVHNGTGEAYKNLAPALWLWNPQSSDVANDLRKVNLRPTDFTVEAMDGGQWKSLPVRHTCDPTLSVDTDSLRAPLADGQARRILFRIGLKSSTPVEQKSVQITSSWTDKPLNLTMVRPAAAPKAATPKPTPSTVKAAAPAAPAEAPKATASAPATPAAAPATELASTGPKAPTAALAGAAAALLALGSAALLFARRRNAR